MTQPKAVIFDLDGTLIDSAPDLTHASNRLMQELGQAEFDVPTIASFIGNGIPKLVERVMKARDIDPNLYPTLTSRFIALYEQDPTSRTIVFDGVLEALETLKTQGLKIAICTNKAERAARIILGDLQFTPYIDVLVGGDTTPKMKPDPMPLHTVIEAMGIAASESIYVGDSQVDAQTAQNAGLDFYFYTGGYCHVDTSSIDATMRFSNYNEFIAQLTQK